MNKEELEKDIENCNTVLELNSLVSCEILFDQLYGKYSSVENFPKMENNPLFLQNHRETYKKYLRTIKGFLEASLTDYFSKNQKNSIRDFKKVFIVHGHDGELKQAVARLIEGQDIEAIILSEQANQGRTIIEKFEDFSEVCSAICLFTADDLGKAKKDNEYKTRARQNVVFEAGYFIGKLGRSNVILIADSDVEMPSDLSSVVYTSNSNWELEIVKELKAIGYNVDANRLIKH